MTIWGIKCKKVFAGPGTWAYVAEAKVVVKEPDELFVTINDYDGMCEYTVSKQSVYAYMAEDQGEPIEKFEEEYTRLADTKLSDFSGVFALLRRNIAALKKTY